MFLTICMSNVIDGIEETHCSANGMCNLNLPTYQVNFTTNVTVHIACNNSVHN